MTDAFVTLPDDATNTGKDVLTKLVGDKHLQVVVLADDAGDAVAVTDGRVQVDTQHSQPLTDAQLREEPLTVLIDSVATNQVSSGVSSTDNALTTHSVITGESTAGGGAYVNVKVNPSGALAVEVGESALPTGAATESSLAALNGKIPTNLTVASTRLLTDGSGVTQPVSASALPLPSGASTESTLSAMSAKLPSALGAQTSVNSLSVVPASDSFPVNYSRTRNSLSALTSNALAFPNMNLNASLISYPYAVPELTWSYAAASGGIVNTTTAVTIKSNAGSNVRNYITSIQIMAQALGAATELAIRDGAGGTVLWRTHIPAGGLPTMNIEFPVPLRGSANTLLEIVTLTASVTGAVFFNAQGFTGS